MFMCMCTFILVVFSVGRGLAMSSSLIHGVLPYVYKRLRNQCRRPRHGKGCRSTGKKFKEESSLNDTKKDCGNCTSLFLFFYFMSTFER
jgi:hypothetical protein